MSMILDVLVIATMLLCVILYTKRGFIKGILGLCSFFIALIATAITRPYLQPMIEKKLHKIFEGSSKGTLSEILDTAMPVHFIASVLSFCLLFVIFILAIKLVTFLLDKFFRLPILKKANRLLGFCLGLLIGFLYAQILSIFLFTFSELLVYTLDWISAEAYEGSVVARWMFDHNIFRILINFL